MRVTIKTKLALTFSVIILLSALSAGLGISSLGALSAAMDQLVQGPAQRVAMAEQLFSSLLLFSADDQ